VVEERLDLSDFDQQRSNDETGRPGYDPRVLLKVVLLGYARGKLSSRKLEAACKNNILFMALTCGQRPDHSTIAEFVSGMGEERIASLFSQVLLVCEQEGLLGGTEFAMDGYKLSSNASKEWSGTHEDLRKKQEKLRELVRQRVREHRQNDRKKETAEKKENTRLKRHAARIDRFLQENEPREGRMGREVQSNITDTVRFIPGELFGSLPRTGPDRFDSCALSYKTPDRTPRSLRRSRELHRKLESSDGVGQLRRFG
jgi:transposase